MVTKRQAKHLIECGADALRVGATAAVMGDLWPASSAVMQQLTDVLSRVQYLQVNTVTHIRLN